MYLDERLRTWNDQSAARTINKHKGRILEQLVQVLSEWIVASIEPAKELTRTKEPEFLFLHTKDLFSQLPPCRPTRISTSKYKLYLYITYKIIKQKCRPTDMSKHHSFCKQVNSLAHFFLYILLSEGGKFTPPAFGGKGKW